MNDTYYTALDVMHVAGTIGWVTVTLCAIILTVSGVRAFRRERKVVTK